jgi:hypothetical protein
VLKAVTSDGGPPAGPKYGVMPDLTFFFLNLQEDGDRVGGGGRGETTRETVEGAAGGGGGGLMGWLKMGTSLVGSILNVDSEFDRKVSFLFSIRILYISGFLYIW